LRRGRGALNSHEFSYGPQARSAPPANRVVRPPPLNPARRPCHYRTGTSHSRTVLSQPPVASVLPSGLNATACTADVPPSTAATAPPSGPTATHRTPPAPPARVAYSLPAGTSQSWTALSPPAEASVLPSGLNARPLTSSACPARVARSFPVATSHNRTTLSPPA